jgi:hypothetical protein
MKIEQRVLWMACAGAVVAGYALIELIVGLFWDGLVPLSAVLATATWLVCWFGVVDRNTSWLHPRVMLRNVPLWAKALWGLSLLSLFVTVIAFAVIGPSSPSSERLADHAISSLLGFYFGLTSSLVAWGQWRRFTAHEELQ